MLANCFSVRRLNSFFRRHAERFAQTQRGRKIEIVWKKAQKRLSILAHTFGNGHFPSLRISSRFTSHRNCPTVHQSITVAISQGCTLRFPLALAEMPSGYRLSAKPCLARTRLYVSFRRFRFFDSLRFLECSEKGIASFRKTLPFHSSSLQLLSQSGFAFHTLNRSPSFPLIYVTSLSQSNHVTSTRFSNPPFLETCFP